MSRDWYIRTDKRNIQDTFGDIEVTSLTFGEKWRKNYKKYILWMIEIAVLIALIVVALPVMFPKDTSDYTVTLLTASPLSEKAQNALCDALQANGEDRNGDGEVQVQVRALAVNTVEEGMRNPALEQLITTLKTDEYTLLAMEPEMYTRYVKAYTADGVSLFEPLDAASAAYENLWQQRKTDLLPTLLWGVRVLPDATGDAKADQGAHLALLKNYVKQIL